MSGFMAKGHEHPIALVPLAMSYHFFRRSTLMPLYSLVRKITSRLVVIGLIGFLVCSVFVLHLTCPEALAQELDGVYQVEGLDDGYRGTLTMRAAGGTYLLEWRLASGESYRGIALHTGNVLSSNWVAGRTNGVVVYRIEEEGQTLNGRYASMNKVGVVKRERLTFLRR